MVCIFFLLLDPRRVPCRNEGVISLSFSSRRVEDSSPPPSPRSSAFFQATIGRSQIMTLSFPRRASMPPSKGCTISKTPKPQYPFCSRTTVPLSPLFLPRERRKQRSSPLPEREDEPRVPISSLEPQSGTFSPERGNCGQRRDRRRGPNTANCLLSSVTILDDGGFLLFLDSRS